MAQIATKWIEDAAVTKDKLNADVAGDGISGGAGTALAVAVADIAGTGLETDGGSPANLRIAAAAAGDGLTGGGGSALAVDSTVTRADGTVDFTGDQSMGSNKLTSLASGTASSDAVNKGQLDTAIAGLQWIEPADVNGYHGSRTVAQINALTPATGDAVVATDAGTPTAGTSDALVAGDIAQYDGTSWKKIVAASGGFPPDGTRALISTSATLVAPLTDATDDGKLAEWDGTSLTAALSTLTDGSGILINGEGAVSENHSFIFDGAVPTGSWIEFSGMTPITAGDGLTKTGNTIDVNPGDGIQITSDTVTVDLAASGGLKIVATEIAVEPADFAGTGLEDDGSDNLRLATQGNGIAGGAGSTLSVDPDSTTGGDTAAVTVGANGVGLDVTTLDGDHLTVDFTPSNYTPDAAPAEAADVDDLAAHFKGVDTALAGISTETIKQEVHKITAGEVTAGKFTLAVTPVNAQAVRATPDGGPMQVNAAVNDAGQTPDFEVSGTDFKFNASSTPSETLSGIFAVDDLVMLEYQT